jgi:putative ABC transport system permease protein
MLRKTPLALFNLAHNKVRTLVATGGVTFAVTLLFMQVGFFVAVLRVAVLIHDQLDFDLMLVSPHYVTMTQASGFPRRRLTQALGVVGVRAAEPLYVDRMIWTNPQTLRLRSVNLFGVDPTDRVFRNEEIDRQRHVLLRPDVVLVDLRSRSELGPLRAGTVAELGTRQVTIGGVFHLGAGFEPGQMLTGDRTFSRIFGGRSLEDVSLGLIRLEPGADRDRVAEQLRRRLPADVRVMTREQLAAHEQRFWVTNTSTGIIFGSGVIVAAFFGVMIIYQVLSTEISMRLSEYATLKALGYSEWGVSWIVFQQAVALAVLGYIPASVLATIIYMLTAAMTKLPVSMTAERAVAVFITTIALCAISGLLSIRILRTADPADLF